MGATIPQTDFLTEQKKFQRVRTAIAEKESSIAQKLTEHGLQLGNFHLLLAAYKDSDALELYVKKKTGTEWSMLKSYEICSRSGQLGPKRKEGDYQVPEGFYHVNMFNPNSNFFLSLGINYPNTSDRRKTTHANPGSNIFIHGSCVTIGCLPMTDDKIKEIYVYAVHARNNGQSRIPVYIFPFKMTDENYQSYRDRFKDDAATVGFWANLKTGYDKFVKGPRELKFTVSQTGDYLFADDRIVNQ